MSDSKPKAYHDALKQFVVYWGEMAPAWGINKTMAQIHALLYAESDPLDTNMIMQVLNISRGNANMNLRSLMKWGLVQKTNNAGSRKDYFTAEKDVWDVANTIIKERQNRELAPVRSNLQECLDILSKERKGDPNTDAFRERIEDFIKFLDFTEEFTSAMLPYLRQKKSQSLKNLLMLAKAQKVIMGPFNNKQGD